MKKCQDDAAIYVRMEPNTLLTGIGIDMPKRVYRKSQKVRELLSYIEWATAERAFLLYLVTDLTGDFHRVYSEQSIGQIRFRSPT